MSVRVQERVLGRVSAELRGVPRPGGVCASAVCQGRRRQPAGHERQHRSAHGRHTRPRGARYTRHSFFIAYSS